ncbi:MAG: hypothetical protein JWL58_6731 [Streptosporangiaceae bacterium]|jgi:hypothetical protein|nr:hypothetical protein [Streptosporangiaceae bacterium]
MRRVTIAVATTLAAGTLTLVGVPSIAQAATGQFTFHTQPGNVALTLNNPQDNQCIPVGNAGGQTSNATNSDAQLFSGPTCKGNPIATLHLGHEMVNAKFGSVRFAQ